MRPVFGGHRHPRGPERPRVPARCGSRTEADAQAVAIVADRIAAEIDALMDEGAQPEMAEDPSADVCACMKPCNTGFVTVNAQKVEIPALPLVFAECAKQGLRADDAAAAGLLEKAKVFHYIAPEEEDEYAKALLEAYRAYLGG